MPGEIWKPVPGFEGLYMVSNQGRVSRITKTLNVNGTTKWAGGVLLQEHVQRLRNVDQYVFVILLKDNRKHRRRVKNLVLEAFEGLHPADFWVARHRDGNIHDNRLSNLEWVTRASNCQHRVANGQLHPNSILSPDLVRRIKGCLERGRSCAELAKRYNVSKTTIADVARGRSWAGIE